MIRHLFQGAVIVIVALACMFYPFMPGRHDPLAVTLSAMSQALGFGGLLLLPIGALWLTHELVRNSRKDVQAAQKDKGPSFALTALVASSLVVAGVALAATITGPSLGLAVVSVWAYIVTRLLPAMKNLRHTAKTASHRRISPAPFYLILVPSVLATAQLLFLKPAVESSRRRAIEGSAAFINAIEGYRAVHGRYPLTLASVHHDYDPPVVGVERYHYEPQGDAYNVFFEQFTYRIGTQEFVMYNPRDEHAMIVHNQDVLESPQDQVNRERIFHAQRAYDAGVPRWKYFWFD